MKGKRILYGALIGVVLLTGCGTAADSGSTGGEGHENHEQHKLANGDIQEKTANVSTLPTFLDKVSPTIKQAYQVAATVEKQLHSIPCYCGCGKSANHKNNAQCFIKEVQSDGSVVWDDHGTRCNTCINIAVQTAAMLKDGKSLLEIRNTIDSKYKEGYAVPTPTPMPST